MTTAPTYDRRAIMLDAWASVRKADLTRFSLRHVLRNALRRAWSDAKYAAAAAARAAKAQDTTEAGRIRAAIDLLENKDRWTAADHAKADKLRAELARATTHEAAAEDYDAKRELIAAAGGRFCAVTFTKADGTERTMQVQPATLKAHVKGDKATEAGQRATATRKARHPHLFPVWDAQAKAPRSVNLATISRIAVDGQIHTFTA